MNRLVCRRLTVNVFWATIYAGLTLYICLVNVFSTQGTFFPTFALKTNWKINKDLFRWEGNWLTTDFENSLAKSPQEGSEISRGNGTILPWCDTGGPSLNLPSKPQCSKHFLRHWRLLVERCGWTFASARFGQLPFNQETEAHSNMSEVFGPSYGPVRGNRQMDEISRGNGDRKVINLLSLSYSFINLFLFNFSAK